MVPADIAGLVLPLLPDGAASTTDRGEIEIASAHDSEEGVSLRVSEEVIELRLPTVMWSGHEPEETTRLWRTVRFVDGQQPSVEELTRLIEQAKRARRREWTTCRFCQERVPVEYRIDENTCHGCATTHLGVVF